MYGLREREREMGQRIRLHLFCLTRLLFNELMERKRWRPAGREGRQKRRIKKGVNKCVKDNELKYTRFIGRTKRDRWKVRRGFRPVTGPLSVSSERRESYNIVPG